MFFVARNHPATVCSSSVPITQVGDDPEQVDIGDGKWKEWTEHSVKIRYKLDMPGPETCKPWTPFHALHGVPANARHIDCVQVAYWAWRRAAQAGSAEGVSDVPQWFVDVSQDVLRCPWGPTPNSLNQGTLCYSYALARVLDFEDRAIFVGSR